jgi:hypothetical protein
MFRDLINLLIHNLISYEINPTFTGRSIDKEFQRSAIGPKVYIRFKYVFNAIL